MYILNAPLRLNYNPIVSSMNNLILYRKNIVSFRKSVFYKYNQNEEQVLPASVKFKAEPGIQVEELLKGSSVMDSY